MIWEAALYERMVDLWEKYGIRSPFEKRLREIAEKKMTDRRLIMLIKRGSSTTKEMSTEMGFSETLVRREFMRLVREGKLKVETARRPHRFRLNPDLSEELSGS